MDEIVVFILIVIVAAFLSVFLAAGLVVVLAFGAIAGLVYILIKGSSAIFTAMERAQAEQEQKRLEAQSQLQLLAAQAQELAERQEQERLAAEAERQRQEQETLKHAEAIAARERLEAERGKAEQVVNQWNEGLTVRRLTGDEMDGIIDQTCSMQFHCGRHLLVTVVVSQKGVAMEWKAHTAGAVVPQVVGLRGEAEMFREWAFAGRHAARLSPGRHVLSFRIYQGNVTPSEPDVIFEVFVPTEAPEPTVGFNTAVESVARDFVERTKTLAKAKRMVSDALTAEGTEPDQAVIEMAKLESELRSLSQEKR